MKRWALPLALVLVIGLAVIGCGPAKPSTPAEGSKPATSTAGSAEATWTFVNKDKVYLKPPIAIDASKYPKAAMNGAPSDINYFAPKDEGILNRVYPTSDGKTFKVLVNMAETLVPQWYYMFKKDGGTLNPALAKSGFTAAYMFDGGSVKMQPNLMLGYYDFAYVTTNILTEYWSGNETQAQSLWRGGDNYVIVGSSHNAGVDLQASPEITSLRQLAGKTVGIMNVGYHSEMMLNKALNRVGLATESAGGNVKIEMAAPGRVMNNMVNKTYAAAFVWNKYIPEAQKLSGYKTLLKWQDMGYGADQANVWLIARRDIVEKYPDVVQAVVQANYNGTQQAIKVGDFQKTNGAAFTEYWQKYYGEMRPIVSPTKDAIDAQANPALLRDIIAYMTDCGYFKIPYTYDQLVNDSFYNNATK